MPDTERAVADRAETNRQVNAEDTDLIYRVQAGMRSKSYQDGPFGRSEICLKDSANRLRAVLPELRN